jgi:hypothetical protein
MYKSEVAEMRELKFYMREYIDWHLGKLPPAGRAIILWNVLRTYDKKRTNYSGDRWSFTSDGLRQFAVEQIELETNEWLERSYNNE